MSLAPSLTRCQWRRWAALLVYVKMLENHAARDWKRLRSSLLLDRPPWLSVFADDVELPDGSRIDGFLRIDGRAYAVIFALTDDQQVLLVEGFKYGVGRSAVQLPAGYLEADESPEAAARRELLEETGYEAGDWAYLGMLRPDGNRGFGEAHYFLARGARRVRSPEHDPMEDLTVRLASIGQLLELLRSGGVGELTAAAGVALALARLGAF